MNSFGNDDFYLFYKKRNKGKVNRQVFLRVVGKLFKKFKQELLKGNIVTLPYGLGSYYIYKYKQLIRKKEETGEYYVSGFKAIDFNATMKLWAENPRAKQKKIKLYYKNEHSDGYKIKLARTKFDSTFIQKIYNFEPVDGFSKAMAQVMFNDPYRDFLTDKL